MARSRADQADGLRRLIGASAPRLFSFLSSTPDAGQGAILLNLAAALQAAGSNVLVMDGCDSTASVSALLNVPQKRTILDGAKLGKNVSDGVRSVAAGFSLATLMRNTWAGKPRPPVAAGERALLAGAFEQLSMKSDIVLAAVELDAGDQLPVPALEGGQIVIQIAPCPDSIKNAYALIKRLVGKLGQPSLAIIVTGADEREGDKVFSNIERVARSYLAIDLTALGAVPADESIARAAALRRPVIDAFPQAPAAGAFRRLAQQCLSAQIIVPE